jgi:voltage-gated potassium channel
LPSNTTRVKTSSERLAKRFEIPVLLAALLVVPVIVIEESPVGEPWDTIATVVNWMIWLVFLAELVTLLVVAENRWRWLRQHPLEVVVVVLTPPFLPASLQSLRVLRLLRLVRLLRLAQIVRRVFTFEGVRYAALLALMAAVGGGTAFASVEKEPSAWDGIWWAATTMTTVGYGDITPQTDTGRILGLVVMVVGIGFGTLVIGAVSQRFFETESRPQIVEEIEDADAELVREIRAIAARLLELETIVQARRTGTNP